MGNNFVHLGMGPMGATQGKGEYQKDAGGEVVEGQREEKQKEQMHHHEDEKRTETVTMKEEGKKEVNESDQENVEGGSCGPVIEKGGTEKSEEEITVETSETDEQAKKSVAADRDDSLSGEDSLGREERIKSLNHSTLYLGNLHPYVDDNILRGMFSQFQGISELKVIKDRATGMSAGYGFARFYDRDSAAIALESVRGQAIFGQQMKVNWALQKEKEDELGSHHHVFVGDLSSEVTDQALMQAFSHCSGCSDARVMWDFATGRSKGYGFVSFVTREQAQNAIEKMDGHQLGARCIRCGWAQHKTESALPPDPRILDQTDPTNTNIYIGNLPGDVSTAGAKGYFSKYGTIVEMKLHRKGNYGFVRYKTHQEAVNAIVGLSSGESFDGRKLKCSWGRHPKVPPSGVKAQLMMAAVSQSTLVHNPHQGHRTTMAQQSNYGSQPGMIPHGFSQTALFTNTHPSMHMERDPTRMMDPLVDNMSGMNLYGNQGILMPSMPPSRLQPHQVDLIPNQFYSSSRLPQQNFGISNPRSKEDFDRISQGHSYSSNPDEVGNPYDFQG